MLVLNRLCNVGVVVGGDTQQCRLIASTATTAGTGQVRCGRRIGGVFLSCSNHVSNRVLAMAAASVTENSVGAAVGMTNGKSESLADRIRLGSMEEDRFSYKEKFIVRCYEVGINKTATVETMANLLQEVGCNHAQMVGFSTDGFATTLTMRKLHLIWVSARMHIEIYRYPAWSDVVEIETWCQSEGRIGTRRDWILKDFATGEVIGRATSKWVMMNQDTRRLQKVTDEVRDELAHYCPPTLRLSFPEENNDSQKKILKLEDPAQCTRLGLKPRRADLDMNQHVNNVAYIGWVLESMPQEIIDSYELQTITLDYRRECQRDDVVDSLTSPEPAEEEETVAELQGSNGVPGSKDEKDTVQFLHILRLSKSGLEINRGRTVWRKKATTKLIPIMSLSKTLKPAPSNFGARDAYDLGETMRVCTVRNICANLCYVVSLPWCLGASHPAPRTRCGQCKVFFPSLPRLQY